MEFIVCKCMNLKRGLINIFLKKDQISLGNMFIFYDLPKQ